MFLPPEIWSRILDFTPIKDQLYYGRAVCRSWRDIIINNKKILIIDEKFNYKILRILNKEKIKILIFRDISLEADKFSRILQRFTQVEHLYFIHLDSWWSSFINIVRLKSLKSINITGHIYPIRLSLSSIGLECKELSKITIKDNECITYYTLLYLIYTLKNIQEIEIINCDLISTEDIKIINQDYPYLTISD